MKSNNRCKKVIFGWVLVFSLIFGTTYIPAFAADVEYTDEQGVVYKEYANYSPGKFYVNSVKSSYYSNIVIPDKINFGGTDYDVTRIEGNAFKNCSSLESVTLPSSVTSIGNYAFWGCSNLTSINLSEVLVLEQYAFWGCSSLTSVDLSKVTYPEDSIFAGCSSLTSVTIPPRMGHTNSHGGKGMFSNCTGLTSVTIEDGVKYIYEGEFAGCSNLTSISIPSTVTSIGDGAFANCGLTSLDIPSSVTSIGSHAFSGCSDLTSLDIPSGVTSIKDSVFQGCSGLTSLDIPSNVTSIGSYAFWGCSGLTSLDIPSNVTSIGSYAFWGCSGLTSVVISDSIKSIGSSVFANCTNLTSVVIPNSVESIGSSVFAYCDKLEDLYVSYGLSFLDSGCGSSTNIWRYQIVQNQEGRLPVKIVSRDQGSGTSIKCDGMGEKYVVDEIEVEDVELTHKDTSEKEYTWEKTTAGEEEEEEGAWKCTANMTCDVCGKPVTETVVGEPSVGDPATCMGKGTTTYTATFTKTELGTDMKDVVDIPIDEGAHSWGEPTYNWEKEGEMWKCIATRVCDNNPEHTETETVVATPAVKMPATCNENGTTTYTATFTKEYFTKQTKDVVDIPIDTDAHSWGEPTYNWEKEGEIWKCTANVTCDICGKPVTETVVGEPSVKDPATCIGKGTTTYTATFTKEYFTEQTKDVVDIPIDTDAHTWNTSRYRWEKEEDTWICTAKRVCEKNPEHRETETVVATIQVTMPATCTQPGAGICIATFTNPGFSQRSISIEIPAGHKLNYEERVEATSTTTGHIAGYTCEMCGQHFSDAEGTETISDEDWVIKVTALLGDVNGDGSVNIKDYVKLYRYVQGLTTLTEEEKARADINKDGSINIKDYVRLYRYVQGLIETL